MSAPTATDQTRGGYLGQSMSVRAAAAYDDDARPLGRAPVGEPSEILTSFCARRCRRVRDNKTPPREQPQSISVDWG